MPQYIPATDVALVELRYTQWGEQLENTITVFSDFLGEGWSVAALASLTAGFYSWWTAEMKPLQSSKVALREIVATDLTTQIGSSYTLVPPGTNVGDNLNEALPGCVTFTVNFKTPERGRSYRGRNYFVGMVDSYLDSNNRNLVDSTFAVSLVSAYVAMAEMLENLTTNAQHVVLSKYTGGAARPFAIHTQVNTYRYADLFVDSRRPRLGGRGD